jgi:cell volume regulation protein A
MDSINHILLIGAALMFAGIILGASSSRLGIPFLLVFLIIGMLAGVDGIGGIQFDDYGLSYLIGSLALAVILLDGGLRTKLPTFRVALKPSLTLATLGVMLTAGTVGAFAMWLLNVDWRLGLLLGTIVGSTDAAAVFSMLRSSGTRLNERVASTLEIESGINDPMAIFLTIALIEILTGEQAPSISRLLLQLIQQFGIGALLGIGSGFLLSAIFKRVHVGDGLHALLLCSGGVMLFAVTNIVGGSGFLAVYLVGLVVGNYRRRVGENVLRAMDGMAWLGQSGMFLLLGLLVTPKEMIGFAGPALWISLFLMFVARPVAAIICLAPFHFNLREVVFIAWVGLRGAVPIIMAIFPYLAGVADAGFIFNVTFMVVLTSLILQGMSIPVVARFLRVSLPTTATPVMRTHIHAGSDVQFELVQFSVPEHALITGMRPDTIVLPAACRIVDVARNNTLMAPDDAGPLQPNDIVSLIAPENALDQLAEIFQRQDKSRTVLRTFYGDFIMQGDAILGDVAAIYGNLELNQSLQSLTLDQAIRKKLHRYAVEGDVVQLCGIQFTVRAVDHGMVAKVGLRLRPKKE